MLLTDAIKTRFVIVEDEVMIREGLCSCVDWPLLGAEVVGSAASGREGMKVVLDLYPDVVITDVVMPHMSGLDMVMSLRQKGWHGDVIFLSAYKDVEYLRRALHCEAIDYIFKPVENQELLSVISQTIRRVHKRKIEKQGSHETQETQATQSSQAGICLQIDHIIARDAKNVCIDSLAASLHISRSSLIRLVKQYCGITVNELIINAKISYAGKLLTTTQMPVHEISDEIGYKDMKHFTSLFRRQTGLLPSEYRRTHSI